MHRHRVLDELPMNHLLHSAFLILALAAMPFLVQAASAETCSTVPMRVEGGSMSPHIAPGQLIEIQQGSVECLGTLKHGDVVLFHSDSSRVPLIKALRGLPGDKFW